MNYYVRKPDGAIVGPMPPPELGARKASGELTEADEVVLASGQSHGALQRSEDWRPLSEVLSELGARANAASGYASPTLDQAPGPEHEFLTAARARTCYAGLRTMLGLALAATLLLNLVSAGMLVAANAALMGFVGLLTGALVAIAVYWLLQMLVDVADLHVQEGLRREVETPD